MNELTTTQDDAWAVMEKVVVQGDLSKLSPAERVEYYRQVCNSVALNPLTQPFAYITLNGKLTLYALKGATDQIRATRHIAVTIVSRERLEDVYVVTARATMPDGRTDESIGAVAIAGLKGDALANALMKAETKAKRRVTLSVAGLGMLDESETETIQGAQLHEPELPAGVDRETSEIREMPDKPIEKQFAEDVASVIAHANNALTMTHVRQAYKRAQQLGLLNVPEVTAAIEAAKERVGRLNPETETETVQAGLIEN